MRQKIASGILSAEEFTNGFSAIAAGQWHSIGKSGKSLRRVVKNILRRDNASASGSATPGCFKFIFYVNTFVFLNYYKAFCE
jgi:hypothetical protein